MTKQGRKVIVALNSLPEISLPNFRFSSYNPISQRLIRVHLVLLNNKIAVITGNPYGIGRVSAALFAEEGAIVICIDDSRDGWGPAGASDEGLPHFLADVSDAKALASVVAECGKAIDRIDILFNLAGRTVMQRFETTTDEAWAQMIGRNLTAAFLCSRQFLPLMKKIGSGAIINHALIDGLLGNPSLAAYSASKGGIIPLTHVMAHELSQYGIRDGAGAARPGDASLASGSLRRAASGRRRTLRTFPLFLASGLSSYVNGANIVVDGGRTSITQGCYED